MPQFLNVIPLTFQLKKQKKKASHTISTLDNLYITMLSEIPNKKHRGSFLTSGNSQQMQQKNKTTKSTKIHIACFMIM